MESEPRIVSGRLISDDLDQEGHAEDEYDSQAKQKDAAHSISNRLLLFLLLHQILFSLLYVIFGADKVLLDIIDDFALLVDHQRHLGEHLVTLLVRIFKLLDFGGFFDDVFHFVLQLQRMVSQLLAVYELLQAVWIRHQLLPFF